MQWKISFRTLSVATFSLLFAYLLSFLFEGQVLYALLDQFDASSDIYIFSAIVAHFAGLFSCGYFIKTSKGAKKVMLGSMWICLMATTPFFFSPSVLWLGGLAMAGYASGVAVAAWGYFLKIYTPKDERIKSCADVLIFSNLIMIAINVVAMNRSPFVGLILSMICLLVAVTLLRELPVNQVQKSDKEGEGFEDLKKPLVVLFLFVAVITVNSGLMYQVINPAYKHLTKLVSWYWAVPYILALYFMRNPPLKIKRPVFLYVGMGMMMAAFIAFMLLGRNGLDYIIVDTLLLGACGIFDLFWWSIIGEMLDYSQNPVKVFGIGLSSNVFGVLSGDLIGMTLRSVQRPSAEVTVIALTIVCITLVILPPLNRQLGMLLKSHAYLNIYIGMDDSQQRSIIRQSKMIDPLTGREQEVLQLILSGKPNKEIAATLFISESTVKTHARNIYSKYDVGSRAELISTILKNQRKVEEPPSTKDFNSLSY